MNAANAYALKSTLGFTASLSRTKAQGHTPPTRTRKRRYKPRARRCQCGCGQTFTPSTKARNPRFASDSCRKRWHRRQAARHRQPKAPELALFECEYCGATFLATRGHAARFCKGHRQKAYEARREAAVVAIAAVMDYSPGEAADLVEVIGLRRAAAHLKLFGYAYDGSVRTWIHK